MNLYLADLHFCHQSVALQRGFSTYHEQDETILKSLRDRSDPNSTLFILGDLFSYRFDPHILEELAVLYGTRVLLRGNHEVNHWMRQFSDTALLARTFADICDWLDISDQDRPVRMSHAPISGLAPGDGSYYLHGHIHRDPPRGLHEQVLCANPHVLNTSLDVISLVHPWGYPCTLEELIVCNRLWKGEWA